MEPARLARKLADLPGIQPAMAREIVEAFPTPELLAQASRDELCRFNGIGALKSRAILEMARKLVEQDTTGRASRSPDGGKPGLTRDPQRPTPAHPFDLLDEPNPELDLSEDRGLDNDDEAEKPPPVPARPRHEGDEEEVVDDIARLLGL